MLKMLLQLVTFIGRAVLTCSSLLLMLRFLKNEGTFQFRPSPNGRLKRQRLIPQSVGIDGSHQSHMFFTDCLKQFDAIKIDH